MRRSVRQKRRRPERRPPKKPGKRQKKRPERRLQQIPALNPSHPMQTTSTPVRLQLRVTEEQLKDVRLRITDFSLWGTPMYLEVPA